MQFIWKISLFTNTQLYICIFIVHIFRYKSLSEAGEKFDAKVNSTQKIDYDWSYNLGESVIDIFVIDDFINKEAWIMILGERNLFCLNSKGKVKFMKRLDYSPICFNVYVLGKLFHGVEPD